MFDINQYVFDINQYVFDINLYVFDINQYVFDINQYVFDINQYVWWSACTCLRVSNEIEHEAKLRTRSRCTGRGQGRTCKERGGRGQGT